MPRLIQLPRWIWIIALLTLILWGLTDVRRRAVTDPAGHVAHRSDFTVYTEAGAAFFDGRDPYAVTNIRGWHYLYPPLFALLVAPLHPLPTAWQGVVWYLLSLLMAGGCLFECRAIIRKLLAADSQAQAEWLEIRQWIVLGAFVALFFPVMNTLQRGQVGVAVLWPLLAGFRLLLEAPGGLRSFMAGICLALPVALKVTPALPVGVLLVRLLFDALQPGRVPWARQRFVSSLAGVAAGLLLFFLILPAAALGWTDNLKHLQTWYASVARNEQVGIDQQFNIHSVRNQSLANAVYRLGNWVEHKMGHGPDERIADDLARAEEPLPMDAAAVDRFVAGVRAVLVLLLLLTAFRWRPGTPLGLSAVFGLACAMTLPLSPISWAHHYVMLLPAILLLPLAVSAQGCRRAARVLALTPAVLLLLHYGSLELADGLAGRLGILGLGTTVWCGAAALLFLWNPSPKAPAVTPIPVPSFR